VTKSPEESAAMALNAGCDLNCGCTYPYLKLSYQKGLVTDEALDTALSRLLRTRFKLGMFDAPEKDPYAKLGSRIINCDKHRQLALEAARRCMVLLKNDNNLLPLDGGAKQILLIGPGAANIHTLLANYYGMSSRLVTILEGLTDKIKDKPAVSFEYRMASLMYEDNHLSNVPFGSGGAESDPPIFGVDGIDVIIAVYGLDGAMEGEEGDAVASPSNGDRDTIELPPWQLKFLRRLRKSGKKTILILTGGSPIAFPEDIADAVIFAWYPGEQGGNAAADIIFGDMVPSGKLPVTFPASTAQLPPYDDYSMKGRTYRYMTEKPLYPFGFGLSYTSFCFNSIELSSDKISQGASVKAAARLTNTGGRDAEEVVQIYIAKDQRGENDPLFSLRAFKRVFVPSGKTVSVEFDLPSGAFETVNDMGDNVLVPGTYTVYAAGAAPLAVSVEKGAPKPVTAQVTVQ
jgi:beta-glucosidase